MKAIGINVAMQHFTRLVRRVEAGEEVVIARSRVPVARLVPIVPLVQRRLGIDVGRFSVPDDFNRRRAVASLPHEPVTGETC